jgi:hypothetical protein
MKLPPKTKKGSLREISPLGAGFKSHPARDEKTLEGFTTYFVAVIRIS